MHGIGTIDGEGAGRQWISLVWIEMGAGAYPPRARHHIDPPICGVGMGMRKIARHPLRQKAIRAWLARVTEQRGRIFAAMRTFPLNVRRQGEGNMCRIGRWSLRRDWTTQG